MSQQNTIKSNLADLNMLIEPFMDRVLLKPIVDEEQSVSAAGVYVPKKEKRTIKAEVVAVGNGYYSPSGEFIKTSHLIRPTNKVIVLTNAGVNVEIKGQEFKVIGLSEIIVRIHE